MTLGSIVHSHTHFSVLAPRVIGCHRPAGPRLAHINTFQAAANPNIISTDDSHLPDHGQPEQQAEIEAAFRELHYQIGFLRLWHFEF